MYAATSNAVVGFSRRRSSGRLSWLGPRGCVDGRGRFGCTRWPALGGGLHDLTMSADGSRLFAVGNVAVVALWRDPGSGAVRPVAGLGGCLTVEPAAGCGLLHDAGEVGDPAPSVGSRVALSPDGATLYTLSGGADESLLVVRVDPVTGGLSQLPGRAGCAGPNPACGDRQHRFVDISEMLAVSPDGVSLYAGGVSFARDDVTGQLSAPERIRPHVILPELSQTVLSGDGRFAYVADGSSFRLFTFARGRRGRLTRLGGRDGCLAPPFWMGRHCRRARALPGCDGDLVLSPGGRRLYVASGCGKTGLAVFRRSPKIGVLRQLPGRTGCFLNRKTRLCGRLPIGETPDVAIAPDGRHLYVASAYPDHIRTLRLTGDR